MSRIYFRSAILCLISLVLIAGCSGSGSSPATPDNNRTANDGPGVALASFAQACEKSDIDAMSALLKSPDTDIPFLRGIREVLPDLGRTLRGATPTILKENWAQFSYNLTMMSEDATCFLYAVKTDSGEWKISFELPETEIQSERQAQWQTPTHWKILSTYIIEYYRSHYPGDTDFQMILNDESIRSEIEWGAFTEDTDGLPEITRGNPHEMAPSRQDKLPVSPQDFIPITDKGSTSMVLPGINTIDWGLGKGPQMTDKGLLYNEFTWPAAIKDYKASEGKYGKERQALLISAFHKFGHVLHLSQDMTCPAHTRNDMHSFLTMDNDPFEDWASLLVYFSTEDTYNEAVAGLPAIQRNAKSGFPGNDLLQYYFKMAVDAPGDQNQIYREHPGISALFWYDCWMTNNMAFTEDTIYQSTVPGSIDTTKAPFLLDYTKAGINFLGQPPDPCITSAVSLGIYPGTSNRVLMATATPYFGPWSLWYWAGHGFHWPSTQAVIDAQKSGSGLLTVSDIRDLGYYVDSDVNGVRAQQYKILFPLCVLSGAELLHEFYLETRRGWGK